MIFAHGPLGVLTALPWRKQVRLRWLLLVGFIGGIFPDIDLFYYYLVNAEKSHHEMITHAPALYIVLGAIGLGILKWRKQQKAATYVAIFSIAAATHTLSDAITSQVILLYPFTRNMYGLTDINHWFLNSNLLFVNFLFEGIVYFFFFYAMIVLFSKTMKQRLAFTIVLLVIFAGGVATLWSWNSHVYHGDTNLVWNDADNDGISNIEDADMDGDGFTNLEDLDADNDDRGNVQEIAENSEDFLEVWYDPTDGGVAQIPMRLGLSTNTYFPHRLYSTAGIFLSEEMKNDYEQNADGYISDPSDSRFDLQPENIRAWLEHTDRLETGEALTEGRDQIGDILFYETGYVAVVTGYDNSGNAQLFDIQKDRPIQERPVSDFTDEGELEARGKLLDARAINN